ncbi:hypothetical protein vseg_009085 [Gypsophila vaccaria]
MEPQTSSSISSISLLPFPFPPPSSSSSSNFNTHFSHLNTLLISSPKTLKKPQKSPKSLSKDLKFLSTSLSNDLNLSNPPPKINPSPKGQSQNPTFPLHSLSVLDRAFIGAFAGGAAGAFTYFCLHPLDTVKTKLQTKGASLIYNNTLDVVVQTFQSRGILGFYSGISAVIVGSAASSAVYFGTCEFAKSFLGKFDEFPAVVVPPIAGAMGNIVSSAIMVPKELITQRMQAGAKGRSWEVLLHILEKDGVLGLYAGYSATLLRNLPAGVISYSSFDYLKTALLRHKGNLKLDPLESVLCGALAGAISSSLTTPLDVVKTRLMTQVHGVVYSGISETVRQILMEEGWVGLTRGMGPRVLHSACFSALGYFAFETARVAISEQYLRHKEVKETSVSPAGGP